ncbi:hypothetical protein B0H10DRAFT_2231068 [Mycena sp. CBHHK59/15]|nr:hypothetical protein B0H10DRAFT_2231068 [Mycena sp. CBHHK59/15]
MSSPPFRIHVISQAVTDHSERLDHPIIPHVEQRRWAPIEPEHACDPVLKPRSRRCFVCGTTGMHPLDFRVCPRTAVLLRRSLAKLDNDGRLVSIDGSPLPMTRHPGGVAAHIISRCRNPTRIVVESPISTHTPLVAHVPRPASTNDRVSFPLREFNSSSPHVVPVPFHPAVPLLDLALPPDRTSFTTLLFGCLLEFVFRFQLRAILDTLDELEADDPATFRERMQPMFTFTRISHFIPPI